MSLGSALVWLLVARLLLDAAWGWPTPVGSASRLGAVGLWVLTLSAVLVAPHRAWRHPWRWPMATFAGVVLVGLARADRPWEGLVMAGHLLFPVVWLLALWAHPVPAGSARRWVAAAAIPVGVGLLAALTGQPAEHVLHDWPRLLGFYGNVHTHAALMAVVGVTAGVVAVGGTRWAGAVALGAVVCLTLTYVRTAWLWAALGCLAAALAVAPRRGAWTAVVVAGGLGALAMMLASGRMTDLVSVITLTPPEGGWAAIGSSRGRIWAESVSTFLEQARPLDVWIGRGLADHTGLHRHFDPHSDVLSLWIQLGLVGLAAWGLWMAVALRDLWRLATTASPRRIVAVAALGTLVGALLTAPLSNDWLTRASAVMWVWALAGAAHRGSANPDRRTSEALGPRPAGSYDAPAPSR